MSNTPQVPASLQAPPPNAAVPDTTSTEPQKPLFDMSKAQPIQKPLFDMSKARPVSPDPTASAGKGVSGSWTPTPPPAGFAGGFIKPIAETAVGAANLAEEGVEKLTGKSLGGPGVMRETQPLSTTGTIGEGAGNIVQFMAAEGLTGDALKVMGSSLGEFADAAKHFKTAQIMIDYLQNSPGISKAMGIIGRVLHSGLVGGAQGASVSPEVAKTGAEQGAVLGAAAEGVKGGLGAAKSVVFPGANATEQVTKDVIGHVLGKKADADVVNEAFNRVNKPAMFSSVENELKLVKPKVDADLTDWNQQLDDVLSKANVKVTGAADAVNKSLNDVVAQAKAGVGDSKEAEEAVNIVRKRILPKLTPTTGKATAIDAGYLNDVKRLVGDQVKKFAPPDMLNSSQKSEQEAYRQVYFKLRDMVSDTIPESKDLNMKISNGINLQDLLEKKFPTLETPEAANASYQGARSVAAKKAATKAAKYVGTTAGLGALGGVGYEATKALAGEP